MSCQAKCLCATFKIYEYILFQSLPRNQTPFQNSEIGRFGRWHPVWSELVESRRYFPCISFRPQYVLPRLDCYLSSCFPMHWTIPKGPFACSYVDTSVILLDTRKPYNILALKLIVQQRRKSTDKLFTNWKWKFGLALVSRRLSFCCEQRDFTSISNCLCLPGERASIMYALCSAVNIKTKCFHKKLLSTLSRKSKN